MEIELLRERYITVYQWFNRVPKGEELSLFYDIITDW